jgi:hypothetical protein
MDDLHWSPVSSSNVDAIAYDPNTSTLYVRFKAHGGKRPSTYMYQDVPRFVYQQLRSAGSAGKFHYAAIRTKYNYTRLS